MYRGKPKILGINKAIIFISLVFCFSLLATEVLAGTCKYGLSDWNDDSDCTANISYADPCPDGNCSGLAGCFYKIVGGSSPSCPAVGGSWDSACSCSGSTFDCGEKPVPIGIGEACATQGIGACKICSKAVDGAGNTGISEKVLNVDFSPPVVTINLTGGCINLVTKFILNCTDSGSGCKQIQYKTVDEAETCIDSSWTTFTGSSVSDGFSCPLGTVCRKKVCYRGTDNAGNTGTIQTSAVFIIDQENPIQTAWSPDLRDWGNTDVSVSVQYSDSDCDMKETKYCWVAAGGSCTPSILFSTAGGGTITKSDSGGWKLCVTATDKANNFITECKEPYRIDKEAPTTVISPDGSNWTKNDVNFTLTCTDNPLGIVGVNNSGCETSGGTEYKIIDSNLTCDISGLTIGTAGTVSCSSGQACQKKVCFRSRDKAGNFESIKTSSIFKIDKVVPYITSWAPLNRDCNGANTDISINVQSADSDSGMLLGLANTKYCWTKGGSCSPETSFSISTGGSPLQPSGDGSWTLCVVATDYAGNSSISECKGPYKVDKTPPSLPSMIPPSRPWLNTDVSVAVTYTDADSNFCGITYTRHCWDTFASCDPGATEVSTFTNGGSIIRTQEGQWTLCTKARDGAGNWVIYPPYQCSTQGAYKIDKTSPVFQSRSPISRDWDTTNISVVVNYTDPGFPTTGSGINNSSYCWTKTSIPCSPINAFTNNTAISQSENGEWMLCTNTSDVATNLSTTDCSDPGIYKKHAVPVCGNLTAQTVPEFPNSFIFTGCGDDPDGGIISQYEFDFLGNGTIKALCPGDSGCVSMGGGCYSIGYTYRSAGNFCAKLKVKDDHNAWSDNTGVCPGGTCTAQIASVGNYAPVLSWTGEGNYTADGLNPEIGNSTTSFIYRVKYTDQENDAPNFIRVHIKKGGTEIAGSPFLMNFVSGTYSGGAIYAYTKTNLIQGSDYTYYFEAQDTEGSDADPTSEITAPIVDNTPPISQFISPGVSSDQSANFDVVATDTDTGGSGLDACFYMVSDSVAGITRSSTSRTCNGSFSIIMGSDQDCRTSGGICTVYIFAFDKAGNRGDTTFRSFNIIISDSIHPTTAFVDPTLEDGSWLGKNFTAYINDSDAGGSGLREGVPSSCIGGCCEYMIDDSANNKHTGIVFRKCGVSSAFVDVGTSLINDNCLEDRTGTIGEATCKVSTRSYDQAGNNSGWKSRNFRIDYTAPTVGKISCAANSGQLCSVGSDCSSSEQGVEKSFCASLQDPVGRITGCWLYVDGTMVKNAIFSPVPCQNNAECGISVNYAFPTSGNHTMRFSCKDAAGNYGWGAPVSVDVTVNHAPVINSLRYTTSPCEYPMVEAGCMVNFFVSASDEDGDPLTYSWSFDDDGYSTNQNPSHHYSDVGTYSVMITVSDDRGGTVSRVIVVPVIGQEQDDQCVGELPSCPDCRIPVCQLSGIWGCSASFGGCSFDSCLCPTSRCVGSNYYSYKSIYGTCKNSCDCDVGTGLGQPCQVTITPNSSGCTDLSVDLKVSNNSDLTNPINWVDSLVNLTVNSKFSLIAIVSGSAVGTVNFKFDTNGNGKFDELSDSTFLNVSFTGYDDSEWQSIMDEQGSSHNIKRLVGSDIFIVEDLISYSQSGRHNPRVLVERGAKSAEDSVGVDVSSTPPNAIIECSSNNPGVLGTCGVGSVCSSSGDISYNRNCIFRYNNNSTDSGGDITRSVWSIFYSDGTPWADPYLSCTDITGTPSNEAFCDLTLPPLSASRSYYVNLYVEDVAGSSDYANRNFYVRREAIAEFECARTEDGEWGNCESLNPSVEENVYFMDKSLGSEISGGDPASISTWFWVFEDGDPLSEASQNPFSKFENIDADSGKCSLEITDTVGRKDIVFYQVYPRIPLPSWQEVIPIEQDYSKFVCVGGCDVCEVCILGTCVPQTAEGQAATALGCFAGDVGCRKCDAGNCTYHTSGQNGCVSGKECNSSGKCIEIVRDVCFGKDNEKVIGCNGACQVCKSGVCGFVDANSDPWNDCTGNCDECDGYGGCRADATTYCTGSCFTCSGSGTSFNCSANQSLCSGNCVTCSGSGNSFSCAANSGACSGNCVQCSGSGTAYSCVAKPTDCTGSCVTCFGSGTAYNCAANSSTCTGNCVTCSGSDNSFSCAANSGACSGNCAQCSGSGTAYSCVAKPVNCTGSCVTCSGSGTVYSCAANSGACSGNCVQCSGSGTAYSCIANSGVCTGNCPTCFGSGTAYSCAANSGACTGNCDTCSGSGLGPYNCAANAALCGDSVSSCNCSGSGTSYNCQACVAHYYCSSDSCVNGGSSCKDYTACNYGCAVVIGYTDVNCTAAATSYSCPGGGYGNCYNYP